MHKVPTNAHAIVARISHMTFSAPLRHEIEAIENLRALASETWWPGGARRRRIRRHRFHHIEAGRALRKLSPSSRMSPEWPALCRLRDMGRAAAQAWLNQNFGLLGRRSTVDLAAKFL